jgi:hypothetical protein
MKALVLDEQTIMDFDQDKVTIGTFTLFMALANVKQQRCMKCTRTLIQKTRKALAL